MKAADSGGVMHVRLDNPLSVRKAILTSAIDSVKLLKKIDSKEVIRSRQTNLKDQLESNFTDLKVLFKKLKEELPAIKSEEKTAEKPKIVNIPVKPKVVVKKKTMPIVNIPQKTGLDKEIEEIEEKLRHLNI